MGRSKTGVTAGWTEGKPWEIAWEESSGGKERYGNDDRVDGRETVGNSLGTGMTRGVTEGKLWEVAWGELRREGGRTGNRGK